MNDVTLSGSGYVGRILHIDLTSGKTTEEELGEDRAHAFLGGKGLGAFLLFRNTPSGADPLSEQNTLIFSTGPLTGTIAPTGNRFAVVTKSPATGAFLDSHCGGPFGVGLKKFGYDALSIGGSCDEQSILILQDGKVNMESAKEVSGKSTIDTEAALKNRFGKDAAIACIGPAGERLARLACIFSGLRAAGRGGSGAVMGSKKLKAIIANGTERLLVRYPELFMKAAWLAHRSIRMHETTVRQLPRYGTNNILETINATGGLPVNNFQSAGLENPQDITGESWRKLVWVKDTACFNCPIGCSKMAILRSGKYAGTIVDGPDYETTWALGPNCGVTERDAIVKANELCDLYGVDTISTGGTIAFAMECFEKGILPKDRLDGIEARFGNADAVVMLTEKICRGEGVGRIMQNGARIFAESLSMLRQNKSLADYAMQSKGLELPAYEPRAAQGMGLGYATSDRGGCHLRAYTANQELLGHGGGVDPRTTKGKAQLVIDKQNEKAVVDSVGICFFSLYAISLKDIRRMVVTATGLDFKTTKDLESVGERVYNLTRLFNIREGLSSKDDSLPHRFTNEPLPGPVAKGEVSKLSEMLAEYYSLRGWNEDGVPEKEKLMELGLLSFLT